MSDTIYIGETKYIHITIFSTDGVTPLTGEDYNDFSVICVYNGTEQEITLSGSNFGEIGTTGTYYFSITPSEEGNYYVRIKGDNDVYQAWKEERFTVKLTTTGLYIIEKILTNRMTIELGIDNHYYQIVYADNGTTELIKWRLYDQNSEDISLTGTGPASRGTPVI
jgi:hypothetical protein